MKSLEEMKKHNWHRKASMLTGIFKFIRMVEGGLPDCRQNYRALYNGQGLVSDGHSVKEIPSQPRFRWMAYTVRARERVIRKHFPAKRLAGRWPGWVRNQRSCCWKCCVRWVCVSKSRGNTEAGAEQWRYQQGSLACRWEDDRDYAAARVIIM